MSSEMDGGVGMNQMRGEQSICFEQPVPILSSASVVGKKEGEGPLGSCFDRIQEDPTFGEDNWESAESAMQKEVMERALDKAGIRKEDLRMIFSGDLQAQSVASSFGLQELGRPVYQLYGACSTMGEALGLAAMAVAGGYALYAGAVTSSHFASAEKEFRFPLEYGNQRPLSATWTVTCSGACILGGGKKKAAVTGVTSGRIIDYGYKDSLNMGACMAPAACDTICHNLRDFGYGPEEYDQIITGDLGEVGQTILLDLLRKEGIDLEGRHSDCGLLIFDNEKQDTHSGGSGCGCSAAVFASYILPKIERGEWKKVLFLPTGALLSKVSYNEGRTIPGIAKGVIVECLEER